MRYFDVEGYFGYGELYEKIIEEISENETILEIGCFKGRSTCYLMELAVKSKKNINIICIDHFLGSVEHENETNLFNLFKNNIEKAYYKYPIQVLKGNSKKMHEFIKNESIYACMIDASHEYEDVKSDILNFLPKIKKGGIICGDDYDWPGVTAAVQEILKEFTVKPRTGGDCVNDIYAGNFWYKKIN